MKIQTIINADLFYTSNVGSIYQVDQLKTKLYNYREIHITTTDTNDDCWRMLLPHLELNWLLNELTQLAQVACETYQIKYQKFNIKYWANINKPLSRNVFHSHKDSVFSGVYYIQATDTGDLRFTNPANVMGDCNKDSPFTQDVHFSPNDRDLILWPSWIPHEVEPNISPRDRINLAFDIKLT